MQLQPNSFTQYTNKYEENSASNISNKSNLFKSKDCDKNILTSIDNLGNIKIVSNFTNENNNFIDVNEFTEIPEENKINKTKDNKKLEY